MGDGKWLFHATINCVCIFFHSSFLLLIRNNKIIFKIVDRLSRLNCDIFLFHLRNQVHPYE